MKKFYVQTNVGSSKYVVNFHDGIKKHRDGSNFYDIRIFKNKKKLNAYMQELFNNGYVETSGYTEFTPNE